MAAPRALNLLLPWWIGESDLVAVTTGMEGLLGKISVVRAVKACEYNNDSQRLHKSGQLYTEVTRY